MHNLVTTIQSDSLQLSLSGLTLCVVESTSDDNTVRQSLVVFVGLDPMCCWVYKWRQYSQTVFGCLYQAWLHVLLSLQVTTIQSDSLWLSLSGLTPCVVESAQHCQTFISAEKKLLEYVSVLAPLYLVTLQLSTYTYKTKYYTLQLSFTHIGPNAWGCVRDGRSVHAAAGD